MNFSRYCYYGCMAVIGYIITGYLIFRVFHLDPRVLFPECRFFRDTGFYCPGCGATRAWYAFLHGHFVKSFQYHPIVDYVMVILVLFLPSQTASILTKGKIRGMQMRPLYFYLFAIIMLAQWACKNGVYYFAGVHLI